MKTRVFYLLITFLCGINVISKAQLQVISDGRVQIGTLKEDEDLLKATTLQLLGTIGDNRAGSKLAFGDFGRYTHSGWNVFIGEYGNDDSDQLWIHGKKGIYLTSEGQANNIIGYYNPSISTNFIFNTNLRVNGINITSDSRLKENIQTLENPLELLSDINAVTYNYKFSEMQKYSDSGISDPSTMSMTSSSTKLSASVSEKEQLDVQYQNEIDQKKLEEANRKHIGFLAQDVQKVLPELVQTDENGLMSIDYIGFIPILVESIKEMQAKLEEQNSLIADLQNRLAGEDDLSLRSSSTGSVNPLILGAKLYNEDSASVSYKIDNNFTTAYLSIYNISGKLLKNIKLSSSQNKVLIEATELGVGTFIYNLVVDGQKADTLKKQITL